MTEANGINDNGDIAATGTNGSTTHTLLLAKVNPEGVLPGVYCTALPGASQIGALVPRVGAAQVQITPRTSNGAWVQYRVTTYPVNKGDPVPPPVMTTTIVTDVLGLASGSSYWCSVVAVNASVAGPESQLAGTRVQSAKVPAHGETGWDCGPPGGNALPSRGSTGVIGQRPLPLRRGLLSRWTRLRPMSIDTVGRRSIW